MTLDPRPEPSLSGRFRLLLESELMSPAKCVFCGTIPSGSSDRLITGSSSASELQEVLRGEDGEPLGDSDEEPVIIDGRLDFEFYGSVYFCKQCTLEMASMYGAVPSDLFESMLRRLEHITSEYKETLVRVRELEETCDNLSRELLRARPVSPVDSSVIEPAVTEASPEIPTEYTGVGNTVLEATVRNEGSGDSEANESDLSKGSYDISDITSLNI